MPEPALPPVIVSPTSTNSLFTGPYGLRAGWRLLIFLVMVAVMFLAGAILLQPRLLKILGSDFSAPGVIVGELFSFSIILIASFIMSRIEHRRFAAYGLPTRGFSAGISGVERCGDSSCCRSSSR